MVDTINPNTNQPDAFADGQAMAPAQPVTPTQSTVPDDRFYGGFDKPENVKINLADTQAAIPSANGEPSVSNIETPQPVRDVNQASPIKPGHNSYVSTADRVNWRGVLVIAFVGIGLALLAGGGVYFGVTAMNNSKLKEQQAQLDSIKQELTSLQGTPTPLDLPDDVVTPTPTTTPIPIPTVVPVPTPVETPVEAPSTNVSPKGTENDALGTG